MKRKKNNGRTVFYGYFMFEREKGERGTAVIAQTPLTNPVRCAFICRQANYSV